jgi:hypothetical protein
MLVAGETGTDCHQSAIDGAPQPVTQNISERGERNHFGGGMPSYLHPKYLLEN